MPSVQVEIKEQSNSVEIANISRPRIRSTGLMINGFESNQQIETVRVQTEIFRVEVLLQL
ncbi:hypothetical protein K0M31_007444 [Melipona bicolor]|uniref:Uncharacterized protein n=1 Tax=Melipona bicolor TaxID=60889 RepID=A0AA40GBF1_9HYME|nr:hypothetical protein K0M31_007444 [Melipona bicolor]